MDRVLRAARVLEEAALEPLKFPDALTAVAQLLDARELSLVNASEGTPAIIHSGEATEIHKSYFEGGWSEIDSRHAAMVRAGLSHGHVRSEYSLVSRDFRRKDSFYQEFCTRFDLAHCLCWSYAAEDQVWGYTFLTSGKQEAPETARIAEVQRLAPYAIRAGMLATHMQHVRAVGIAEGLAKATKPALVIDHRGHCAFVTESAERVFDEYFSIRNRRLWAADSKSDAGLAQLTAAARAPYRAINAKPVLVVRPDGTRPVLVAPVHVSGASLDGWPGARLIVMLLDQSYRPERNISTFQNMLGLTFAESRIAASLLDGVAISEIAKQMGIQVSTVRQYLKAVFAKTGVHRQAELVALLSRIDNH